MHFLATTVSRRQSWKFDIITKPLFLISNKSEVEVNCKLFAQLSLFERRLSSQLEEICILLRRFTALLKVLRQIIIITQPGTAEIKRKNKTRLRFLRPKFMHRLGEYSKLMFSKISSPVVQKSYMFCKIKKPGFHYANSHSIHMQYRIWCYQSYNWISVIFLPLSFQ